MILDTGRVLRGQVTMVAYQRIPTALDRDEFVDPSGAVVRTREAILAAVQGIRGDLERLAREEESLDDELMA